MRIARWRGLGAVAVLAIGALGASAFAYAPAATREVVLTIRHSRFSASQIQVSRGETVRFVVRNTDPIAHELIVGPPDVQERHEAGREAHHPPRDGEVSVPLFATRRTRSTTRKPCSSVVTCRATGITACRDVSSSIDPYFTVYDESWITHSRGSRERSSGAGCSVAGEKTVTIG